MKEEKDRKDRIALVVEGGGMRGIFSAGVLKSFGEETFDPFDLYIGVSAGACNLASHLCGQFDRNYMTIAHYGAMKEFIDYKRFLLGGHLMDLDWHWDITMREIRLDLKAFDKRNPDFVAVATSMKTGKPLYLEPTGDTLEHEIKVSSALPILFRRTLFMGDEPAADGGVADSIPAAEAWRRGAGTIMIIRSQKADYRKKKSLISGAMGKLFFRKYPAFARAMAQRYASYNAAIDFLQNPPEGCRIIEVLPPETFSTGRTTTDPDILNRDYEAGCQAGLAAIKIF